MVLFNPAMASDDGDTYSPSILSIDDAERISTPDGGLRPPVSQSELVEGFYAPGEDLQKFLQSQLGVDSQPYVGEKLSVLPYSGGEQLMRRLAAGAGRGELKALDFSLLEVQKCIVVGAALKNDHETKQSVLRQHLRERRTHLVLLTEGNATKLRFLPEEPVCCCEEDWEGTTCGGRCPDR